MEVLWVDFFNHFYYLKGVIKGLRERGIEVTPMPWRRGLGRFNIDEVCEEATQFRVVVINFGNLKRWRVVNLIGRIKKTGTKVVTNKSWVGADAVVEFQHASDLAQKILSLR